MNKPGRSLVIMLGGIMWLLLILPVIALAWHGLNVGGWRSLPQSGTMLTAIWLSIRTTFISLLVTLIAGTPLAYALARYRFRLRDVALIFIEMPVVMPPAVAGLGLLLTFGRRGLLGGMLASAGITVPFTTVAVILAQIFVSSPFYIRTAQVGFASIPGELEDAARVDGASELQVFWWITFPLSLRSLAAGGALAWARAMGEFGATILFAGNLQGRTQTMTLLVYDIFQRDLNAAVWTGLILIAIALVMLLLSQWLTRVETT